MSLFNLSFQIGMNAPSQKLSKGSSKTVITNFQTDEHGGFGYGWTNQGAGTPGALAAGTTNFRNGNGTQSLVSIIV